MLKQLTLVIVGVLVALPALSQTWSIPVPVDSNLLPGACLFGSPKIGYLWGSPFRIYPNTPFFSLYKTVDSGKTWSFLPLPSRVDPPNVYSLVDTEALFWLSGNNGFYLNISRSLDGGKTWSYPRKSSKTPVRYQAMFTRSTGILDLDTTDQATYMTYDTMNSVTDARRGGDYYVFLGTGSSNIVGDWSDSLHWCYAIQFYNGQQQTGLPVVVTTDGGRHWANIYPDSVHARFTQVSYLRGTPWVWVERGGAGFCVSSDYGLTWHSKSYPSRFARGLVPVSPNEVWAYVDSTAKTYLLHSTDSGNTWQADSSTFRGYTFYGLNFTDPRHGWVLLKRDTLTLIARFTSPDTSHSAVAEAPRNDLHVYPNPATGTITIDAPDHSGAVVVLDLLGREVLRGKLQQGGSSVLDVSALTQGVYELFLQENGKRISMQKLVIDAK